MFAAKNLLLSGAVIPPAYDAVGVGAAVSASSLSWAHTIGAKANAVVVPVTVWSFGGTTTVTAKVGTTSLTLLDSLTGYTTSVSGTGYYASIYLFGLLSPPTGAQTINVTLGTTCYADANSTSYNNVSSFGTAVHNTGSGTSLTQSISSGAYQVVAQAFTNGVNSSDISSYNQTQRYHVVNGAASVALIVGDASGATTVNFSCTLNSSGPWGAIGVPLKP